MPFVFQAGNAIFSNLPLIFGIGVAVGLSKDNAGAAALAGGVGYLVFTAAIGSLNDKIDMGVLSGIIMGITAGIMYNKFNRVKLVDWLAFFGGKRFVPIVTSGCALVLAFAFSFIWPPVQAGINAVANWIIGSGELGTFVYGTMNRLLIPTGLHHILNNMVWFQFGEFTNAAGEIVRGDLHRFFAGDPTAGNFMAGFFPVMMFGLPAACLAMFTTARKDKRAMVGGVLFSVAFTAFLTGVTEPVEYLFMFLAPALYGLHAILTGISLAVCTAMGVKMGFGFSAGAIDYVLNYGLGTNVMMLLVIGAAYFALYYFVFVFAIKAFNLQTPGREDEDADAAVASTGDKEIAVLAKECAAALGGLANLESVDSCITRLRLTVHNPAKVDEVQLKRLGAKGVVKVGEKGVQVVLGTHAELVAESIRDLGKGAPSGNGVMKLLAPVDGEIVPIENTPDPVFAEKTVGDGVAIVPTGDKMVAPADGTIGKIFETNHAFSMITDGGLEVFVHFGIDTVELKGEGFTRLAEPGAKVSKGDPIIGFDLALLKEKAKSVITPVVVSNCEDFGEMTKATGKVRAGMSTILAVEK
ncbi:N-acetylglucosamine-specific PTS transporter subunit IIBC [Salidesulfovibrio onnuriiensis]|uniref:N-acetylglucosamine-specific PTS transporter subunit IIBC n=1 Tax=Salidesulfovibrio onnuriiensis TaxID=2583823 RepID=UPI001C9BCADD|nr:N-acetylglucosamine-specific PTS transporter subunit IIBC [Salidesulfovibrio onnuriiensis]